MPFMKNTKLIEIVKRVPTEGELQKALKMINELVRSGADTVKYDIRKNTISTTGKMDGYVETTTRNIDNIGQRMEYTQIDTNDKKARNEYIVSLRKEGYSQNDIARITGLTQPMISAILKAAGVS